MRRTWRWAVATVGLVLTLGACSAETADDDEAAGEDLLPPTVVEAASAPIDGAIADSVDLEGLDVYLGSTLDSEGTATERLLAGITRQALIAAGADVSHQGELGGGAARDALTAGEIDLYWEGAGEAWTALLRQPAEGLSAEEIHDRLADRDLAENGVAWLDALAVEDGPRFAEAADPAEGEPVARMSAMGELLATEEGEDLLICADPDFSSYAEDGRVAVEGALGITFGDDQVRSYDAAPAASASWRAPAAACRSTTWPCSRTTSARSCRTRSRPPSVRTCWSSTRSWRPCSTPSPNGSMPTSSAR
jgi:glycine betaine/choline ABC-type transport system substrate-binding protein